MSSSHAPIAPTPSSEPPQTPQPDTSNQSAIMVPALAAPASVATTELPRQTYLPQLVLLGAAILGGLLAYALPDDGSNTLPRLIFNLPGSLLTLVSIYSFVVQWRALRASRPILLRLELILLIAAAVLPAIALVLGDLNGAAAFNNAPTLSPAAAVAAGIICGILILTFIATANAVYIATRFHKATKILGIVAYGVTWVAVAIVTYAVYGFQYSSHDPNFE